MPTIAQSALSRGFSALNRVAGESWSFGALAFSGVLGSLKIDDPRMAGATDRLQVLTVAASAFTARPKRGSTLTGPDGHTYSVSRVDDASGGLVEIVVSRT